MEQAVAEAWARAQKRIDANQKFEALAKYQTNPVGFGEEVLGEVYYDDLKLVMESVMENPVTIVRSSNGVGKSFTAAAIGVWFFKAFQNSQVYMAAAPPFDNLRRILWGEVMARVMRHPKLFEGDNVRAMSVNRNSQSFITGVAIPTSGTNEEREAKFSGKHAPHILFIVDEGDAVPEEVYKGIESCMSGGMARLLVLFNPRLQAGNLYIKEKKGLAKVIHLSAFEHPNVKTGEDLIPGAVNRDITLRRINEWTRPLYDEERVSYDCYEVPNFLIGTTTKAPNGKMYDKLGGGWRKVLNPSFSYMVLGVYPAQSEWQLISQNWIDEARNRWDLYASKHGDVPPVGIEPVMGLDVADLGTDPNACCLRYGGYVAKFQTWNGVDPDMTARKALQIYRDNECNIAMVDGTGCGSGVAPSMSRLGTTETEEVRAISIKMAGSPTPFIKHELGEFHQLRDQLWWACREWLRQDPTAMLPPDPILLDELRAPTYMEADNGKIRISKKDDLRNLLKHSPDRAEALVLTFAPFRRPEILTLEGF